MTAYLGKTVMKQFGNSPTLLRLLADFDDWCDLTQFSADFLADVWDISTAVGFGLDIWGRILGQSRYLAVEPEPGVNFGFDTGAPQSWQPWSQAPFWGGLAAGKVPFLLSDDVYRQLLLVKAAANIAKCDAPSLNAILRALFGTRGQCYVQFSLDNVMHIVYVLGFTPTPQEQAIIQSGVIPVPAGMSSSIITGTGYGGPLFMDGTWSMDGTFAMTGVKTLP